MTWKADLHYGLSETRRINYMPGRHTAQTNEYRTFFCSSRNKKLSFSPFLHTTGPTILARKPDKAVNVKTCLLPRV